MFEHLAPRSGARLIGIVASDLPRDTRWLERGAESLIAQARALAWG